MRRFVAKLRGTSPLPFRRMECEAGEEAQVDFGTGAWIELPDGKRRRSHVFRIVLSFSRKGYSEAVYRQTTEDFIRCMENAFWHFGGVPKVLVIDNLKAAVKHPDWYDPELNPKIQSFCEHYGVRDPAHEASDAEAQGEDRKRRGLCPGQRAEGPSLHEPGGRERASGALGNDRRRHPDSRHDPQAGRQAVSRKWSVGPCSRCRWSGSRSSTRGSGSCIGTGTSRWPRRITRCRRSTWATRCGCVGTCGWCGSSTAAWSRSPCTCGRSRAASARRPEHIHHREDEAAWSVGRCSLLSRARLIGEHTARWAEAMLQTRGIEGVRVLQGLLAWRNGTTPRRSSGPVEVAFSHGAWRLRTIRQLLEARRPRARDLRLPRRASDHSFPERLREAGGHVVRASLGEGPEAPVPSPKPPPPSLFPVFRSIYPEGVLAMKESLLSALRKLRLSGLAQTLEVRLQEAASHNLSHAEFLELILQDELTVRQERLIDRRVKAAGLP